MVCEICKDELFLARKAKPATPEDITVAEKPDGNTGISQKWLCGHGSNMIGVDKRIIAFDNDGSYMVMFNPEILQRSGPYQTEEGCLSLTGVRKTNGGRPSR